MIWILAQLDEASREAAVKQGWWNLSFILLVGTIGVLFLITFILLRRWKHNQLKNIEKDRAQRRAGMSAERTDAWATSAQRYVDHDKLAPEDDLFERDDARDTDDDAGFTEDQDDPESPDEDDRDPFGLFFDKPYHDPDEDDDEDFDQGEDWGDEDDEDEDDKR